MTEAHPVPVSLRPALTGLLACALACSERAGRAWEPGVLAGLFGHAFESSWAERGRELWPACVLEWSRLSLHRAGIVREAVDHAGNPRGGARPGPDDRRGALASAWDVVGRAAAGGRLALGWGFMSPEQKAQGLGAFCWSVVEGVDSASGEYLVAHPGAGRFRVGRDEVGRVDPVEWLHVEAFTGQDPSWDASRTALEAIGDAIGLLSGSLPSADMPAPASKTRHGLRALDLWAKDLPRAPGPAAARAGWWANAREAAGEFCRWAAGVVDGRRAALEAAAADLEEQADLLRQVAAGGESRAELARRAVELQARAIESLRAASG